MERGNQCTRDCNVPKSYCPMVANLGCVQSFASLNFLNKCCIANNARKTLLFIQYLSIHTDIKKGCFSQSRQLYSLLFPGIRLKLKPSASSLDGDKSVITCKSLRCAEFNAEQREL